MFNLTGNSISITLALKYVAAFKHKNPTTTKITFPIKTKHNTSVGMFVSQRLSLLIKTRLRKIINGSTEKFWTETDV